MLTTQTVSHRRSSGAVRQQTGLGLDRPPLPLAASRLGGTPTARRYAARIVTGLGRAFAEVSRPRRVEFFDRRQQPPVLAFRRGRRQPQRPAEFGEQLVTLSVVTG
jgi:hypothetical protein